VRHDTYDNTARSGDGSSEQGKMEKEINYLNNAGTG